MSQISISGPQKKTSRQKVAFEYYAPEAKEVFVAGDFNEWGTRSIPLRKGPDGTWKIETTLSPGRYEYRYIVDGDWQNDQRPLPSVPNAFGSWNSVIEVSY